MNEKKTLEELREESETLIGNLSTTQILFFIYIAGIAIFWLTGLFASEAFVKVLSIENSFDIFPVLLQAIISGLALGYPLLDDGSFNFLIYSLGCFLLMVNGGIYAYIFHNLLQVFKSVKKGESPFTIRNAECWKKCYRVFAVLTMICFISAFIIKPMIVQMLPYILYACFFNALYLIFLYGSGLQEELDETL